MDFNELKNKELHDIFQVRINVFVVEQDGPYPKVADKDIDSLHLFKKINDIAYARILPPKIYHTKHERNSVNE